MLDTQMVRRAADEQLPFVKETFTQLHQNPELSMHTKNTSALVQQQLRELGVPFEIVGNYSVIALLDTGRPGNTLLLRADMDALPMDEATQNDKGPKQCVAQVSGAAHTCGHDAHTAILLGAARTLCGMREKLVGKLYFVFEEAEETGGVADIMEQYFADIHLDCAWAIHVYAKLATGKICVTPGQRMSGFGGFAIRVNGQGGHGSRPDLCRSPIMAAANMIQNLSNAWISQRDITKIVTLSIGSIHAGTKANIIPDCCEFAGSMRYFDYEAGKQAMDTLIRVCKDTARLYGCTAEVTDCEVSRNIATTAPETSAFATACFLPLFGKEGLADTEPWYGSEPFAVYCRHCPGIFAFLGCRNEDKGMTAEHHNPHFEVDQDCLQMGVEATCQYAANFLHDFKPQN